MRDVLYTACHESQRPVVERRRHAQMTPLGERIDQRHMPIVTALALTALTVAATAGGAAASAAIGAHATGSAADKAAAEAEKGSAAQLAYLREKDAAEAERARLAEVQRQKEWETQQAQVKADADERKREAEAVLAWQHEQQQKQLEADAAARAQAKDLSDRQLALQQAKDTRDAAAVTRHNTLAAPYLAFGNKAANTLATLMGGSPVRMTAPAPDAGAASSAGNAGMASLPASTAAGSTLADFSPTAEPPSAVPTGPSTAPAVAAPGATLASALMPPQAPRQTLADLAPVQWIRDPQTGRLVAVPRRYAA